MNVAYLANSFPEPVEPYVWEEIEELRKRGVSIVPCSMRRPRTTAGECPIPKNDVVIVLPVRPWPVLLACWLLARNLFALHGFVWRALRGPEALPRRLRTLAHTFLGAVLAARLAGKNVGHIHVHHGYFAAWAGMVAARILHAKFSMTLHGSDLLVRADYLDVKLAACDFCFTVSEFNRQHILERYGVEPQKILLRKVGVDPVRWRLAAGAAESKVFSILSVGRLHPVKNHQFVILACHQLKTKHVNFRCLIAGEGEQRSHLQAMISRLGLEKEVVLLGHVPRERLPELYAGADAVVLASHSEGIPVTLMEAMAMERLVIAPRITGISELVSDRVNGLLYSPGSISDFVAKLEIARTRGPELARIRRAAREQICREFDGPKCLKRLAAEFISRLSTNAVLSPDLQKLAVLDESAARRLNSKRHPHANPLLQ